MIQGFTEAIKESWILKGFLGLVMISFAVWGVGDAINPAIDPNVVIKVDKVDVSANDLQRRFNSELTRLKEGLGPDFTASDARKIGVLDNIIAELSQGAALDMAANDMNLIVSDKALRQAIQEQETFQDETGRFSRVMLNLALSSNNLTEQDFVNLLRSDTLRQTMVDPVVSNLGAPSSMIDALFKYRAEQRVAETLYIPDTSIVLDDTPSESDLREVYEQQIELFQAPEYRHVEAIVIKALELVPLESIERDEIQKYYDDNISSYQTKASRSVRQIIYPTKEDAQSAYERENPSGSLSGLVDSGEIIDLGTIQEGVDIGFDTKAIFLLDVNQISKPIETLFGWHLFEVTELSPGSITALPVVQDQIRSAIANDRAFEEVYEAGIYLEDQLAAGIQMRELGSAPGYNYIEIQGVDRFGKDNTGATVAIGVPKEKFIKLVFSSDLGVDSNLVETDDFIYILKVTKIIASQPKSFSNVQTKVAEIWRSTQIATEAKDYGIKLADSIGISTNMKDLDNKKVKVEFATLGPITRLGDSLITGALVPAQLISSELTDVLFSAAIGETVHARVSKGYVVARLTEIVPPDSATAIQIRDQISNSVSRSVNNDLLSAFVKSVTQNYNVVVNQESIDQIVPQ